MGRDMGDFSHRSREVVIAQAAEADWVHCRVVDLPVCACLMVGGRVQA